MNRRSTRWTVRVRVTCVAAVVALLASCTAGGGGEERTILVDFSHDEFASFFLYNFPEKITVRQGMTLVFRQTWTGEPHTVTAGTVVDDSLGDSRDLMSMVMAFEALAGAGVPLPNPDEPGDATFADFAAAIAEAPDNEDKAQLLESYNALRDVGVDLPSLDDPPPDMSFEEFVEIIDQQFETVFAGLPWALDETEDGVVIPQNAGQPCYLTEGLPPEDPDTPCDDADQDQPVFDGSHSYYNSGIIPYEGPGGNTFTVQLADDLEPGSYLFYCAVHGPIQMTEVEVVAGDAEIPSQADVSREARREIERLAQGPREAFQQAVSDGAVEIAGERLKGPFAGLYDPSFGHAGVNEFIPREMTVGVGEPVTWKMMGAPHTISFGVPSYFPIMEFLDDGTVRINPQLQPPAGGAPDIPEHDGEGILQIDGGTWDGEGFWSSGLISAEPYMEYTLRISEPGSYAYACLLHPPMVGTLEVVP